MVRAGQVVAVLDASVFSSQLNSIETSIAKAELDIERYKKLVDMGGATAMQIESVVLQHKSLMAQRKQVLEQMSHMQIRAPFSGRIENVNVELGSFVTYGTVLSNLLNNGELKINVYLSEQEAFTVKEGQAVNINSVVLSEPKVGHVSMISDKADASGKFLAEIKFANNDKEILKAGVLADVFFSTQSVETGLSVPVSALIGSSKQAKVFVAKDDHVELREIKSGIVTSAKIQVLEGLQAGEQVVISGQLNLENGTTISINK
jgi:RND family efflux transporter MFP subunit